MPTDNIKETQQEGAEEEEGEEEERRSERRVQMRDWHAREAQEDAQIQQLGSLIYQLRLQRSQTQFFFWTRCRERERQREREKESNTTSTRQIQEWTRVFVFEDNTMIDITHTSRRTILSY